MNTNDFKSILLMKWISKHNNKKQPNVILVDSIAVVVALVEGQKEAGLINGVVTKTNKVKHKTSLKL